MRDQKKRLRAIRAAIDEKYGKLGPGTPTPLPPA